jgi:hypothetical protein
MLTWLPIALLSVVALSVVFGSVVAAVLGRISREVSKLWEARRGNCGRRCRSPASARSAVARPRKKSVWPHRDVLARK